nr:hypothetical protein [Oceanococcus sp. HetDA_MAG_MS8]
MPMIKGVCIQFGLVVLSLLLSACGSGDNNLFAGNSGDFSIGITVDATSFVIVNGGAAPITVEVFVRNSDGSPVQEQPVELSVDGPGVLDFPENGTNVTDESGKIELRVLTQPSAAIGDEIIFTASFGDAEVSNTFLVVDGDVTTDGEVPDGVVPNVDIVPGALNFNLLSGITLIQVQVIVTDQNGSPLDDVAVALSIASGPGLIIPQSAGNRTDELGRFSTLIQLDPEAAAGDVVNLTARVGDVSQMQSFTVLGGRQGGTLPNGVEAQLSVLLPQSTLGISDIGNGVPYSVLLTDTDGFPLEGVDISVLATGPATALPGDAGNRTQASGVISGLLSISPEAAVGDVVGVSAQVGTLNLSSTLRIVSDVALLEPFNLALARSNSTLAENSDGVVLVEGDLVDGRGRGAPDQDYVISIEGPGAVTAFDLDGQTGAFGDFSFGVRLLPDAVAGDVIRVSVTANGATADTSITVVEDQSNTFSDLPDGVTPQVALVDLSQDLQIGTVELGLGTVEVTDQAGRPIEDAPVALRVTGPAALAQISLSGTTDAFGELGFAYRLLPEAAAGDDLTIIAEVAEVTTQASVRVLPTGDERSAARIQTEQSSLVVNEGSFGGGALITLFALDATGAPIADFPVTLDVVGPGVIDVLSADLRTDLLGQLLVRISPSAEAQRGDVIQLTATGMGASSLITIDVVEPNQTSTGNPPAGVTPRIAYQTDTQQYRAGSDNRIFDVSAIVTDSSSGQALNDVRVETSISGPAILVPVRPSNRTNNLGELGIQVVFRDTAEAGDEVILSASVGAVTQILRFSVIGPQSALEPGASLVVSASRNTFALDELNPITYSVVLTDQTGAPVADQPVGVTVTSPGFLRPTQALNDTDELGRFSFEVGLSDSAIVGEDISVVVEAAGERAESVVTVVSAVAGGQPVPEKISLIADATELLSGSVLTTEGVTITALVTDANNRLLENQTVNFSSRLIDGEVTNVSDAGTLNVTRPTTNATGTAEAVLSTGGNPRARVIEVSATVDGFEEASSVNNLLINVVGTTLELNGPTTLGANQANVEYVASLTDSLGRGIRGEAIELQVAEAGAEPVPFDTPRTSETDASGVARFLISASELPNLNSVLVASVFADSSALESRQLIQVTPVQIGFVVAGGGFEIDPAAPPLPATLTDPDEYDQDSDVQVPLEVCLKATVELALSEVAGGDSTNLEVGDSVQFATTRGALYESLADCRQQQQPNPDFSLQNPRDGTPGNECALGVTPCFQVEFFIRSEGIGGAGPTLVSAVHAPTGATVASRDPGIDTEGPSIEFVSITPERVVVQARPASIPVSGQSEIRATVRDASNNIVKGQFVDFSLNDPSGGRLSATSAITGNSGSASVTYFANTEASALNGVSVTARVRGSDVENTTSLTVGSAALRITLGTGNELSEESALDDDGNPTGNPTIFAKSYSVIVTDAAGNPAPSDTEFRIRADITEYQKGCYELINDEFWVPRYRVPGEALRAIEVGDPPQVEVAPFACEDSPKPVFTQFGTLEGERGCINEDRDLDGILDQSNDLNGNGVIDPGEDLDNDGNLDPGEDRNGNGILDVAEADVPASGEDIDGDGRLDPGNVVVVPSTTSLNENGVGFFQLRYPQDVANWARVRLVVTAAVQGTEAREQRVFVLPASADDINEPDAAPPGVISPFGVATSCDVDG